MDRLGEIALQWVHSAVRLMINLQNKSVVDHWYKHFKNIQNIHYNVIAAIPTLPLLLHFDDPPIMEVLEVALS